MTVGAFRASAAVVLLAAIVAAWFLVAHFGLSVERVLEAHRDHPVSAILLFVALHCLAAATLVPCSPFTLAAGLLWGPLTGLVVSVIAAFGSSCLTFGLARFLAGTAWREKIASLGPYQLMARLGSLGWRGVALAQLNPVVPSSTLGYLFGLSPLPFRTYAWAALLFMLPLQVALVGVGAVLRGPLLGEAAAYVTLLVSFAAVIIYLVAKYLARTRQPEVR